MAEGRDDLTPADAGTEASGAYTARRKDPDEIEQDIRETRAEMSETLDAIGARFRPEYIKEQAKDALRNTARDAGTTMLDTIKANPIPSLIAGLSVGWLIAKGGQSDRDRYGRDREDDYYRRAGRYPDYQGYRPYGEPYGYSRYDTGYSAQDADGGHSLKEKASDAAGQAKEKVGELAGQAKDKVSGLADHAADQFHEIGDDVQRYGREATNWLEHQMDANPLAVGAVALAAGALVGLAVPGTQKEDELLGRASDRLTDRVKDVTEEKLDQVKAVAKEAAGDVKEKAREVVDTAKEEAKNQGLMASDGGPAGASGSSSGSSFGGGSASGASASGAAMGASGSQAQGGKARSKAGPGGNPSPS